MSTRFDEAGTKGRATELSGVSAALDRAIKNELAKTSEDVFHRGNEGGGAAAVVAAPSVVGDAAGVSEQLERRSREWTAMVRLLEQNRYALDCAEMERDSAYKELVRILPIVQETAKQLTTAMDECRTSESMRDLSALFTKNGDALDELERTAVTLSAHFLRCRTVWEQYAQSVENAQRMRGEAPPPA